MIIKGDYIKIAEARIAKSQEVCNKQLNSTQQKLA